jgi:hypothetical protein
MLLHRVLAVFSVSLTVVAACSSGGSSSSSASTATGTHASTSGGSGGTGTASGSTGGATPTSSGAAGSGGSGGVDAGPVDSGHSDAELLDAADEALGKGGLKLGVACGANAASPDAGTCGEGLSCCYPCKEQMCDSVCTLSCNPHVSGCEGGCIPQL